MDMPVRRHRHRGRLLPRHRLGSLRRRRRRSSTSACSSRGQTFRQALDDLARQGSSAQSRHRLGFHVAITDLKEHGTLADLARLPDEGVTTLKLFMAYKGAIMSTTRRSSRACRSPRETGALVMVHAENGDAIDMLVKRGARQGQHRAEVPRAHAPARARRRSDEPRDPARPRRRHAAVRRARLVHRSIHPIERAREAGWNVYGETCSQYLFFDDSSSTSPGSRARSTSIRRRRARRTRQRCGRAAHG